MNVKKILLPVVLIAQFAAPAWIAHSSHTILKDGAVYKFKTQPVDPYDVFRGRYVAVSTDQNQVELPLDHSEKFFHGQKIYALLGKDESGFARVESIRSRRPHRGDYIQTKVLYVQDFKPVESPDKEWKQVRANIVNFQLPIDRYYMNEKRAPQAEKIYRENAGPEKPDAYLQVRVLRGQALIEDLVVGGKSIGDYLEKGPYPLRGTAPSG